MIRKYKPSDLDPIMDIWLDASIKGQAFISSDYWQSHSDTVRNDYMPQSEVFVYEKDGVLLGFMAVVGGRHIGALFVSPSHWRQGVGKALMAYGLSNYHPPITLAAFTENARAVAFYKGLGFKVKEEEIEAESGHPEYIMEYTK